MNIKDASETSVFLFFFLIDNQLLRSQVSHVMSYIRVLYGLVLFWL